MGATESRVKVALTFDFDGMAPWLQVTTSSPSFISRGEFGPIGVGRIKDVLDEFGALAGALAVAVLRSGETVDLLDRDGCLDVAEKRI